MPECQGEASGSGPLRLVEKRKKESEVTQLCPTLCDPMDYSLPGASVYGIFQARILEWVAISFSKGSSQLRDRTRVSLTAGSCITIWVTREALMRLMERDAKNRNGESRCHD